MFGKGKEKLLIEVAKLQAECVALKSQIDDLKANREQLLEQNKQLQDALVSKVAPEVYYDNRATKFDKDAEAKKDPVKDFYIKYIAEMEKDSIFDSAEDMIQKLTQVSHSPVSKPVHNNEES